MSQQIIMNGIMIFVKNFPSNIMPKNNTFYICQIINQSALNYCLNPVPGEQYYPENNDIVVNITNDILQNENFTHLEKNGVINTHARWIVCFGYYFENNIPILCFIRHDHIKHKYYLVDANTGTIKKESFPVNSIMVVIDDNNNLFVQNLYMDDI